MITRAMIVAEALTWVGTPFAHYQCCKGAGVDCAHLIIGVGKSLHIFSPDFKVPYYPPQWHRHKENSLLLDTLYENNFSEKSICSMTLGDVVVFKFELNECHIGILAAENMLVHAWNGRITQKIVHTRFPSGWKSKNLKHCFAYPGVGL